MILLTGLFCCMLYLPLITALRTSLQTWSQKYARRRFNRHILSQCTPVHESTANNNMESTWLPHFDNLSGFGEDFVVDKSTAALTAIGEGETYGEILPSSIRAIIQNFMNLTTDDVMYDLGSGIGKTVAQFAYETECGKCVGIEIGERRHREALAALNSLRQSELQNDALTMPSNKIILQQGDCAEVYWGDATVLFINALCFPPSVWAAVDILIRNDTPRLRYLILGGQQLSHETESKLQMSKSVVSCPATWADDYFCFLYTKSI